MRRILLVSSFSLSVFFWVACGTEPDLTMNSKPSEPTTSANEDTTVQPLSPIGKASPELGELFNRAFVAESVYFAGSPTSAASFAAAQNLGVTAVINLLSEPEQAKQLATFDESALLARLGMRYESLPTTGTNLSLDHAELLDRVMNESDGRVLVHCASSNRAGAVWAIWLNQLRGVPVDDAIAAGKSVGLSADSLIDAIKRIDQEN